MQTWRLEIEYEGTRYGGWQQQPHARTIQGELVQAAQTFLQRPCEIGGAGRTDAGVHALNQVAHLKLKTPAAGLTPRQLQYGLNDLLPHDINVLHASAAPVNFHARHDATARYYLYQLSTRRTAFAKAYVWWVKDRLDVRAMTEACALFVGRHDFRSFCEAPDTQGSTIVQIAAAQVRTDGDLILIRIGASHFLWKMVRRLVGTLVAVGRGRMPGARVRELLNSYSNEPAALTAPPSGLFFERALYGGERPPTAARAAFPVASFTEPLA